VLLQLLHQQLLFMLMLHPSYLFNFYSINLILFKFYINLYLNLLFQNSFLDIQLLYQLMVQIIHLIIQVQNLFLSNVYSNLIHVIQCLFFLFLILKFFDWNQLLIYELNLLIKPFIVFFFENSFFNFQELCTQVKLSICNHHMLLEQFQFLFYLLDLRLNELLLVFRIFLFFFFFLLFLVFSILSFFLLQFSSHSKLLIRLLFI
jgi:hypothetical protein